MQLTNEQLIEILQSDIIIDANGTKRWYLNGKLHRVDGPSIEYDNGSKRWYRNGKRHRIDGPAIKYADGINKWFINGVEYSEAEYTEHTNENC